MANVNQIDSDELTRIFFNVYKYGKYYNPATLHYVNVNADDTDECVGCDRCMEEDISACIGWGDYDLCLHCVCEINEQYERGEFDFN